MIRGCQSGSLNHRPMADLNTASCSREPSLKSLLSGRSGSGPGGIARASVKSDPFVWSGRALQENFADLAVSGLASMHPTFDWSVAPGHRGYQRACDLISGKASRRPNGSPVLARAGKTEPPSRLVLSQTSAGNSQFFTQTKRLTPWPASPRSFGHQPERPKQSWPVCWQARSQEHCGAAASWRPRSRA
jgi:hypothetical protein